MSHLLKFVTLKNGQSPQFGVLSTGAMSIALEVSRWRPSQRRTLAMDGHGARRALTCLGSCLEPHKAPKNGDKRLGTL